MGCCVGGVPPKPNPPVGCGCCWNAPELPPAGCPNAGCCCCDCWEKAAKPVGCPCPKPTAALPPPPPPKAGGCPNAPWPAGVPVQAIRGHGAASHKLQGWEGEGSADTQTGRARRPAWCIDSATGVRGCVVAATACLHTTWDTSGARHLLPPAASLGPLSSIGSCRSHQNTSSAPEARCLQEARSSVDRPLAQVRQAAADPWIACTTCAGSLAARPAVPAPWWSGRHLPRLLRAAAVARAGLYR